MIVQIGRLVIAWGTVVAFLLFGGTWLAGSTSSALAGLMFVWLLGTISWCAFA